MARLGLSQARVLDAATELADEIGLEQFSLGKLAKHLGVKTPSLYNHVASLEDLKQGLAKRGLLELGERLKTSLIAKVGFDALTSLCHETRAFAHEQPTLFQATLRTVEDQPEDIKQAGYEIFDILQAVLESYKIDGEDAIHAMRAVRAAITGFVVLEQSRGFGMAEDVDRSFERLILMVHSSLENYSIWH